MPTSSLDLQTERQARGFFSICRRAVVKGGCPTEGEGLKIIGEQMRFSLLLLVVELATRAPAALAHHRAPSPALQPSVHHRSRDAQLFFGGSLPAEIEADLSPTMSPAKVLPLWKELRKCYPSESEAIAAAKKQPLVILPFINTADNIRFNYEVLCSEVGFTREERLDIITRNPGVLANKPGELARTSKGEVRFSVDVVTAVDGIPEEVRFAIPTFTAVALVALLAKRFAECAGGICQPS